MSCENEARFIQKIITGAGVIPTIPLTNDHTDGTWQYTDLYVSELALNIDDNILYTRTIDGIISLGGLTGSGTFSVDAVPTGGGTYSGGIYVPSLTTETITTTTIISNTFSGTFSGTFIGDGSLITGIVATWSGGTVSNDVEFTSNTTVNNITIDGNVTTNLTEITFDTDVFVNGYVQATSFIGDGSQLTGITITGSTGSSTKNVSLVGTELQFDTYDINNFYNVDLSPIIATESVTQLNWVDYENTLKLTKSNGDELNVVIDSFNNVTIDTLTVGTLYGTFSSDIYTTTASLTGSNILFERNDGGTYSVDLTTFAPSTTPYTYTSSTALEADIIADGLTPSSYVKLAYSFGIADGSDYDQDYEFYFQVINSNTVNFANGVRLQKVPAMTIDYWNPASSYAIGAKVRFSNFVFVNINGNPGSVIGFYLLDDTEWTLSTDSADYEVKAFRVSYNINVGEVDTQSDENGNICRGGQTTIGSMLNPQNTTDIHDWNMDDFVRNNDSKGIWGNYSSINEEPTQVYSNVTTAMIYNNDANQVVNNNIGSTGIKDNNIDSGNGNISYNQALGIYSNVASAISYNNSRERIRNNVVTNTINYNRCGGGIHTNTVNSIFSNINETIYSNLSAQNIDYNTISGRIANNSNTGNIIGNQGSGNIEGNGGDYINISFNNVQIGINYNIGEGDISYNIAEYIDDNDGLSIMRNKCGGYIVNNNALITNNIVNKNITNNIANTIDNNIVSNIANNNITTYNILSNQGNCNIEYNTCRTISYNNVAWRIFNNSNVGTIEKNTAYEISNNI